jgi:branched-chain amino acid transport system substrate-binding protein
MTPYIHKKQRASFGRALIHRAALATAMLSATSATSWADPFTIGFATAQSGWMLAYDGDGKNMAQLWIEDRNKAGGLLGQPIKTIMADTKSDRVEGARAGQSVVDQGANIVIVSCDYDQGSPAAGAAQRANLISVFLCAEDPKAGVQGVGPNSFTTSAAAHVQGAVALHWAAENLGVKHPYVLLDTVAEYDKSLCAGFRWAASQTDGVKIVGEDTFKNDDPSIQSQITRITASADQPDAIMLCSFTPGGASAIRQIRAAGIKVPILSGSAMDGTYWTDAVPGLSDFYVPVAASVHGDDPRPEVQALNERYKARYGTLPATTYAYPIYAFLDLWARAVEKAGTADSAAVTDILNTMHDEQTFIGPRSFTPDLHIQQNAKMQILQYKDGKVKVISNYALPQPVPVDVLFGQN